MAKTSVFDALSNRLREIATLQSTAALLSWDQETMMPPKAAEGRAEQLAQLAALCHERMTDPALEEALAACEADERLNADPRVAAELREARRDLERARRVPAELVTEISLHASRSLEAWKAARASSDFATYRPFLDRTLELERRRAACLGTPEGGEPYDALLQGFEPGMTAAEIERLFDPLRADLATLAAELRDAPHPPDDALDRVAVPIDRQKALNRFVAEAVGYDFGAGRLDESTHPFTEGVGLGDTRITTRFRETHFPDALGSTLHEVGHALYEQGLPKTAAFGRPVAEAAGLGVHESQSRTWENQVGRSRPFWEWLLPHAKRILGDPLEPFDVESAYRGVNRVEPGPIRVEADEVTYNLHIMLRFALERALLSGDLATRDLPAAWNDRMRRDLGVAIGSDAEGCLQDIHWSMGAIGYFPTYTLGNLYAAQMWEQVRVELDDLDDRLREGAFAPLLDWLRRNVHRHGRTKLAPELCEDVTGRPLDHRPLVVYLREKLVPLYGAP